MQAALASVSDLATLMQTTTTESFPDASAELAQAELLLQMASAWARSYAQRLWPTVASIPDYRQDTVVGIILAAVRRELINPRRVTYEVQGPESATYNIKACPPGFYTDEEISYLERCSVTSNWWVQSTYRDDHQETLGYLFATGIKAPVPMYVQGDPGFGSSYQP